MWRWIGVEEKYGVLAFFSCGCNHSNLSTPAKVTIIFIDGLFLGKLLKNFL